MYINHYCRPRPVKHVCIIEAKIKSVWRQICLCNSKHQTYRQPIPLNLAFDHTCKPPWSWSGVLYFHLTSATERASINGHLGMWLPDLGWAVITLTCSTYRYVAALEIWGNPITGHMQLTLCNIQWKWRLQDYETDINCSACYEHSDWSKRATTVFIIA